MAMIHIEDSPMRQVCIVSMCLCCAVWGQSTIYVNNDAGCADCNDEVGCGDTQANACDTIQYAYNAASSGDTISVAAGTYAEDDAVQHNLYMDEAKDITIVSTSGVAADVVIKAASATTAAVDYRLGTHMTIRDVTFDGTGLTAGNNGVLRIGNAVANGVLEVSGCVWQNVDNAASCVYGTTGGSMASMTFTNCTMVGGVAGIRDYTTNTLLVIDSSTVAPADRATAAALRLQSAHTSVIIRNGSTLTGNNNGHGILNTGDVVQGSISITDSTVQSGTGSAADAIHLETGDTVTLLTIDNSTVTCRASGGQASAIELGGTATTIKIINGCTIDGGDNGAGLCGYDGTNYGTGTWIYCRDSTFTGGLIPFWVPKYYAQVDVENCTFRGPDNSNNVVRLGVEVAAPGQENDHPLGLVRWVGNTVAKTGSSGHAMLFGDGCGSGLVTRNHISGGDYGIVVKSDNLEFAYNDIYHTGTNVGFYLAGAQECRVHHNSVYSTSGHAFDCDQNQLTDPCTHNVVTNNLFVTMASGANYAVLYGNGGSGDADEDQIDYNLYYAPHATKAFHIHGTDYATLAQYQAGWAAKYPSELFARNDANSVWGDPGWVYPGGGRFEVVPGSLAIGRAIGGGTLGAFSYLGYDPRWIDAGRMPGGPRRGRD